jgi:hypothetical protein
MKIDHILQVLICLAIIYFLFSTLASIIFEWYSFKTQKRGRMLQESIHKLLNDALNQNYGATFYAHPGIDRLKSSNHSYPHYISSSTFADAVIDIIGQQSDDIKFDVTFKNNSFNIDKIELRENRLPDVYAKFVAGVNKMKYSPFKKLLTSFYEKTNNYQDLKKVIAAWFDDYMERVSGWYKLRTKRALFWIGLLIALLFNLDSIRLVKVLNQDSELRKNLIVAFAQLKNNQTINFSPIDSNTAPETKNLYYDFLLRSQFLKDSTDAKYLQRTDSLIAITEDLSIPVGYHSDFKKQLFNGYGFYWLIGILFSAFALSFGAPFWFDVLVKLVNIRRSGIKPKTN